MSRRRKEDDLHSALRTRTSTCSDQVQLVYEKDDRILAVLASYDL